MVEPNSCEALESTTVMYTDQIVGLDVKGSIRGRYTYLMHSHVYPEKAVSCARRLEEVYHAGIEASWPTNYTQGSQQQSITTLEQVGTLLPSHAPPTNTIKIAKPGMEGTHRHALHHDLQNLETSTSLPKSNPCISQSDLVSFKGIPRVRRSN
ncbi:hypothetical protein PspLS_04790 [Pyricularia sp. CBS 133598]|nr:hypothetical protein PspLS_04790 [Pyricularia sp. CBS 133598]